MRLGYKSSDELLPVLDVLNKYPLHSIILHPRIGTQKYTGYADSDKFAAALEHSKHQLIYNGDIINLSKFQALKRQFPATTCWMLGRGALMNPFLAREIRGDVPGEHEKRDMLRSFHEELYTSSQANIVQQGKQLGWMKAIWYYMGGLFSDGISLFHEIKRAQNHQQYLGITDDAFSRAFSDEAEQESYFRKAIARM